MLSEEGVKVGFVSESACRGNVLNGALLLFGQQLLCMVQSAEIQEFMKGTSRKGSEVTVQLRSADGKLLGDGFGIDVIHEVRGNVSEHVLDVQIEFADDLNLRLVAQMEQMAQKQNHCQLLLLDGKLPYSLVHDHLADRHQSACLRLGQSDQETLGTDRPLHQSLQAVLVQQSLGEVKHHTRDGRFLYG